MKDAKQLRVRAAVARHEQKLLKPFVAPWRIPHTPVHPETRAPAIGGHEDARLRRGRGEPEARLDLHGLTHDGAYRAPFRVLMTAKTDGKRLRRITGRRRPRSHPPPWRPQEMKGMSAELRCSCDAWRGGAFYVA
jgi:DNA-nicking Smr family endonuclease